MDPTEDQLRAAYAATARDGWERYDDLKRAAAHWALVRLHATRIARGLRPTAPPPDLHTAAVPPAGAPAAAPAFWGSLRAPHGPMLDNKRAAAGERDDD